MEKRLRPFAKLDYDDYYMGEQWRDGGDSEEEMSSDDELKTELKKLAGIRTECSKDIATERQRTRSEFEDDMEDELDRSMTDYASSQTKGDILACIGQVQVTRVDDMDSSNDAPASSSEPIKKTTSEVEGTPIEEDKNVGDKGDEDNIIIKMAKSRRKDMKKELPEFYDAEEDDENERWVQEHRTNVRGANKPSKESLDKKLNESRPAIDDGSDAVLSCPGCMSLLTRDCQRHELYQDQYRAMFVENCVVDIEEKLTISKTGKDKRREKQKLKKQGLDPAALQPSTEDVFQPVKCRVCGTKVAVMDRDEVYHFFNVLSGYA